MLKKYQDYIWKKGLPIGQKVVEESEPIFPIFKIIMDPYRRHVSIERYQNGQFDGLIYDSNLINFRKLSSDLQSRWQRIIEIETETSLQTLIRDENDRVIFREYALFENNHCRYCRIESPHGLFIAHQRIFYTRMADSFNGVILYDVMDKPVLCKRYHYSEETQAFGELISEEWDVDPTLFVQSLQPSYLCAGS